MVYRKLLVGICFYMIYFVTYCKAAHTTFSATYIYKDENGNFRKEEIPPMDINKVKELLQRRRRQVPMPGMMPQDLQGINQMVRFKPYRFSGRRRQNPELLFPGAVIGDGVSQPIGSFNGIGYFGESDIAGMAPTIYDRLPMPNLFQVSYPGLMPDAAAAAGSDLPIPEEFDPDLETGVPNPLGNNILPPNPDDLD